MSENVDVYNLDGTELLTTFSDLHFIGLPPYDITERIEERLAVPKENQVIFVNGKKWLLSHFYFACMIRKINLGCQWTKTTVAKNKLLDERNFNGSFAKVIIRNKFRGQEIWDEFNSKPSSTYLDLKLYLENKFNMTADLQVILRRYYTGGYHYWEPKNDEYLISYMFDDNGLKIPRENIVYLCAEESNRSVTWKDDIIKIKPISIYSQHGPNEVTKIITILPEERAFTISGIKSKIEEHFGLPAERQIIYCNADGCKMQGNSTSARNFDVIDKRLKPSVFDYFNSVENEVVFYLTGDCRMDQQNLQICKEYGIKILQVHINTPSGNVLAHCQLTPSHKTFGSLKSIVEETHKLSVRKQIFYDTSFKRLDDHKTIWVHFSWQMVNSTCTIYLLLKKTESSKDDNEICEQLEIPQISSNFAVKPLGGSKTLLTVDMKQLKRISRSRFYNDWFSFLTQDIEDKLELPPSVLLCLGEEILHENHALTFGDWQSLYFIDGNLREEIVFYLTFKPTLHARIEEFCEEHDIPTLKTLKVKFLASEIEVDLRKKAMESIWQVKRHISNEKKIPKRAVDIFLNGRTLNNEESLIDLFIKEYSCRTSIEFTVVVKTINIKIHLKSPYRTRLQLPVDGITMPGSKTFYDVKEEIARLTGIPISQLLITCSYAPGISNEAFIQDLLEDQGADEIEVTVWKTVSINIVDRSGNTKIQIHDIVNDIETVCLLLFRLNFDNRWKLRKNRGISRNTLLHDLGSEDVIELKEKEKRTCRLM